MEEVLSFSDESEFASFLSGEDSLSHMTSDAVTQKMQGFRLSLRAGRDEEWLAMAARRALAISQPNPSDGPGRMSNASIRRELDRRAEMAQSTWVELFNHQDEVDFQLHDLAWQLWDGEDIAEGALPVYSRYRAAVRELEWLAGLLRDAAKRVESQRGPWVQAEVKRMRIERAQYLAPVFEAAFDAKVTANGFPSDARHLEPTPFMDFYQRMVAIAFDEERTMDLSGVLKEACRLHRGHPVQFSEGIIPGL